MHRADTLGTDAVESTQIVTRAQDRALVLLQALEHTLNFKENIWMNNEFVQKLAQSSNENLLQRVA